MKADSFRDFVLDQLRELADLGSRAMFGGHGLYLDDQFFGIVFQGRLYFKTTAASLARYQLRDMKPFRPNARQTLQRYYEVPADIVEDRHQLVAWAREALG